MKKNKDYSTLKALAAVTAVLSLGLMVYVYGNYKASREYYLKSYEFLEKKDFYLAGECLQAAIYYDNDFAEAYFLLGKIDLEAIQDADGSLNYFHKAIELSSRPTGTMYFLRGKASYLSGPLPGVMGKEDFEKALELDPSLDSAHFYLAKIYHRTGNTGKAISHYSRLIEKTGPSYVACFGRGINYFSEKNYKLALADLNKGLAIRSDGEMYYYRGLCLLGLNRTEEACTDFANAISHDFEKAREKQDEICGLELGNSGVEEF